MESSSSSHSVSEADEKRRPDVDNDDDPSEKSEALVLPDTANQQEEPRDLEKPEDEEKKPAAAGMMDPSSFPEGGTQAWLVVLGGFCCLFVSFGWINAIGVFQDYYQRVPLKSYSPSTVAWIPSLQIFMMFFWGPVIGKFYDNYGPRYILLLGSFMHVFGLFMTSISTKYYQILLSQAVCSPIGASMIFYAAMSPVSSWFLKRRALAFGIVASGSSLGGVIFPIMVERIIRSTGFGWAMRSAAFLILGLLVVANLTIRSRIPPTPRPFALMHFITPLGELPFALVTLAAFLFFFGMFLPFTFVILEATSPVALSHPMSQNLAQYLLAILNAVSIFGRIIPGYLADRFGRFNIMIVTTFFSAIIVLALWLPARANAPILVFAALYGFSTGAFVSLITPMIAQISDIRQIGVRQGTVFAIISFAGLGSNPSGGSLVARQNGGYSHLQIFCGVNMLAGATVFVAARWSLVGFNPAKKV